MARKWFAAALTALCAAALSAPASAGVGASEPAQRPNVVVLLLDDATVADVRQMPAVQQLLAAEGTTFANNYTPFPHCCPARATILTGLYPHNHHVLDINPPYGGFDRFDDQDTIATYLDPAYRTGMVGKYLNKFDAESVVSPGWDFFQVPVQGVYNYLSQEQKAVDGSIATVDGYMPQHHADQLMGFIDVQPRSAEPYFALLGWVAPHNGIPADRRGEPGSPYVSDEYRDTYDGPRLPTARSFDERRIGDKRLSVQERPRLTRRAVRRIRYVRAQRRESLMAVDQKVAELVELLASRGELDETYIMLTSDNGWMEGQHRIPKGKLQPYEESAAVPLIVRGPGFAPGTKYRGLTGLQDLVPTILDLTGTPLPATAPEPDGVSLVDLVSGQLVTQRPQLIEIADNSRTFRARGTLSSTLDPPWFAHGVVTGDGWKYVEFPGTAEVEMYDLEQDPNELRNLANRADYTTQRESLQQLLLTYHDCTGQACRN